MKILKRNVNLLIEEVVEDNLNELVAIDKCEALNRVNAEEGIYYIVLPDDYMIYNLK